MDDYKFEMEYWGDCCNTFDEEQKHYIYAKYMNIRRNGYGFDVGGKTVIDIGGGPVSMLLKCSNLKYGLVCDPISYPAWTVARYEKHNIGVRVIGGEEVNFGGFDEAWVYNCLQHTEDPGLIIENALKSAKILRLFEWVDIPPHDGHPHCLTKDFLDKYTGGNGEIVELAESGCCLLYTSDAADDM
jgi:hypothetical protein